MALLPLFSACEQGKRDTVPRPRPVMVHDTVASGSFSRFIDPKTRTLAAALLRVGFQPDSSSQFFPQFEFKKRVKLVPRESVGQRKALGTLAFGGIIGSEDHIALESVVLNFLQGTHSGRWCLVLNNGYVDLDVHSYDESDLTRGLPPEFHTAVKRVFPDLIDVEALESSSPPCID